MGILAQLRSLFRPSSSGQETPAKPQVRIGLAAEERRRQPRVNARPGTRVMIVDGSRTILVVLRKFLRSAGYETCEAPDAETALALLPVQRPELIFLDIVLPGMNGFAALRAIRGDPAAGEIPVIMMSGDEEAMEQFFGNRIDADGFVKKPFSCQEVFFSIERLLDDERIPRRAAAGELWAQLEAA
ncbi:MAG: response regulator [Azonexus sp.]|jgi:twitching motility two-component system response regulator PilH|nr:response regulator [Azonexus sp.]